MTTVCIWGQMNLTGHASVLIGNDYLSFHPENPELLDNLKETLPPEILGTMNPLESDLSLPEQPNELERISTFLKSLGPKSKSLLDDSTMGTPSILRPLDWDKENGGGLVRKIDINWLDEYKMQSKLREVSKEIERGKRKYQLFVSNCSTLSAELLLAGAGSEKFDPYKSMKQLWNEINARRPYFSQNEGRILEYVREKTEFVLQCQNRGSLTPLSKVITSVLLASDFLTREFCWTPGDVKVLAEELARHNR